MEEEIFYVYTEDVYGRTHLCTLRTPIFLEHAVKKHQRKIDIQGWRPLPTEDEVWIYRIEKKNAE